MKIFILDTNYPTFTAGFWAQNPTLIQQAYQTAWRALMDECFGTADFYSYNLKNLGHEAIEVVANDQTLQGLWAHENGLELPAEKLTIQLTRRKKIIPWLRRETSQRWATSILKAQIEQFAPDVLYVQDINWTSAELLKAVRPKVRLIAGQTAYPLEVPEIALYDVIFTSFPHYVKRFRAQGIKAHYLRIAFEERILGRLGPASPRYDIAFAGGLSKAHEGRLQFLEQIGAQFPLDLWGYGVEALKASSPLRARHHGPAWGLGIYQALQAAKISLNFHIDVAQNFANNMRLYEATGVGSLLLTDQKSNLNELFEVDREVVAYQNAPDAIEKIRYLLDNPAKREAIAQAGQKRTLRDHTYARRMEELAELLTGELKTR